ncbi:MAG: hypothetical protein AAF512_22565, partial [Pseudomonadota bacterium]
MSILTPLPERYPLFWLLKLQIFTRLSAAAFGGTSCIILLLFFWACGAFNPTTTDPWGASAELQILGRVLFYSMIASYILGFTIYAIGLCEKTLDNLRTQLDYDDEQHAAWRASFSRHPPGLLILSCFVGAGIASLILREAFFHLNLMNISIVLGNIIVWTLALQSNLIFIRNMYVFTLVARAHLKVNLWHLEALSPFVHIGI